MNYVYPYLYSRNNLNLKERIHTEHHRVLSERALDSACKRGFSAARASANADDYAFHTALTNTSPWLLARLSS